MATRRVRSILVLLLFFSLSGLSFTLVDCCLTTAILVLLYHLLFLYTINIYISLVLIYYIPLHKLLYNEYVGLLDYTVLLYLMFLKKGDYYVEKSTTNLVGGDFIGSIKLHMVKTHTNYARRSTKSHLVVAHIPNSG